MLLLGTMANEMPGLPVLYCQGAMSVEENSKEGFRMAWGQAADVEGRGLTVVVAVMVVVEIEALSGTMMVVVETDARTVIVYYVVVVIMELEGMLVTVMAFVGAEVPRFAWTDVTVTVELAVMVLVTGARVDGHDVAVIVMNEILVTEHEVAADLNEAATPCEVPIVEVEKVDELVVLDCFLFPSESWCGNATMPLMKRNKEMAVAQCSRNREGSIGTGKENKFERAYLFARLCKGNTKEIGKLEVCTCVDEKFKLVPIYYIYFHVSMRYERGN
jgi:hypothetical protein